MASVGDSITAGFLSNWRAAPRTQTEIQNEHVPEVMDGFEDEDPSNTSFPEHPRHGIGPRRLRLGQIFNNKYTLSWSSGYNIHSHYIRVRDFLRKHEPGMDLEVYNTAMSGSVAADLPWQAENIVREWSRGIYRRVSYITVTIGANDSCATWTEGGNSDNEVRYYIRNFFKILSKIDQDKPIKVMISAIPRIPDLAQPEILNHYLTSSMTCEWDPLESTCRHASLSIL